MKIIIILILICLEIEIHLATKHDIVNTPFVNESMLKYQVGLLNKIPDGPLTEEEMTEAMNEQVAKESGNTKDGPVGIITFSDSYANKKLGKLRIKAKGMELYFPTDSLYKNYTALSDDPVLNKMIESKRIESQASKIVNSEKLFTTNPFKEILDSEELMSKLGVIKVHKNYKKNLLALAAEKEQELFNKMVNNEQSEVKERRFNKGFYNQIMKFNLDKTNRKY